MDSKRTDIPRKLIEEVCRRHHIRKQSVFGSYLREDFGLDSDIDLLVDFVPEYISTLFDVAGMEIELSGMLSRKVDLRTAQDLSRYFRDEVVAQAEVRYEDASESVLLKTVTISSGPSTESKREAQNG